eukprot:6175734-Pleurochrysis_carterae.AAC.1
MVHAQLCRRGERRLGSFMLGLRARNASPLLQLPTRPRVGAVPTRNFALFHRYCCTNRQYSHAPSRYDPRPTRAVCVVVRVAIELEWDGLCGKLRVKTGR